MKWGSKMVILGCIGILALAVPSHGEPFAAQFPSVSQVTADYPDEAQRYVALNTLWDWMHAKAPSDPTAQQLRKSYYDASTAIRQQYLVAGAGPGQEFDDHVHQTDTRDFERSVLDHYHVLNIAASSMPSQGASGDVTDAMIKGAFLAASPFILGGLVVMYVLTYLMSRNSSRGRLRIAPPSPTSDLPALPENLRIVKVPGLAYSVEALSGLVLDKETTVRTTTTTTFVPSQVQPGSHQTYSDTSSIKTDMIWVRLADGREDSWAFTGSNFQVRPSHVISALAWQPANGSRPFLFAYNHMTGQGVEVTPPPHGTSGCLGWILSFLVGTVAFAIAIGIIMSIDHGDTTLDPVLLPVTYVIMGAVGSLVASTLIVFFVSGRIVKKRNAVFTRSYLPGFRQFFEASTPAVKRHFGVAQD